MSAGEVAGGCFSEEDVRNCYSVSVINNEKAWLLQDVSPALVTIGHDDKTTHGKLPTTHLLCPICLRCNIITRRSQDPSQGGTKCHAVFCRGLYDKEHVFCAMCFGNMGEYNIEGMENCTPYHNAPCVNIRAEEGQSLPLGKDCSESIKELNRLIEIVRKKR